MEINETMRAIVEVGIGIIYFIGAIFNFLWTRNHGEEFFGSFANGAWFKPARAVIERVVIPNSRLFAYLLATFLLLVSVAILSGGESVVYGLYAGALFCLGGALVSSVPGAIANLVLAAVQFLLAYSR
jgi:hypothetical protein